MIRLPKRLTFRLSPELYDQFCQHRREAGSPWWDESAHIREAIRRYIAPAQAAAAARAEAEQNAAPRLSDKSTAKRRTRSRK